MSLTELEKALKEKNLIIGTEMSLKGIRSGKISTVFLAQNCPDNVKESVNYYAGISKIKVIQLKESNEEIAMVCKKPFPISVLSY